MRWLGFSIFTLLAQLSLAQPVTYFEFTHDFNEWVERSSNPVVINDTIYWTTAGFDFAHGYRSHLSFLKFDLEGTLLAEVIDSSSGRFKAGQIVSVGDTSILCKSSYSPLNADTITAGFRYTKFDIQGQGIWEKTYHDSGYEYWSGGDLQKITGGFIGIGQKYDSDDSDMVVQKIDHDGNLLWERTYGGNNHDAANEAVETEDGGIMIVGWTRSYGAGSRDIFLVKTDSQGNQQWYRTYGNSDFDTGNSIDRLQDGNYIISGYRNRNDTRQGYLCKVDSEGNVIWENDYGSGHSIEELRRVLELPNGDFLGAGLYDENLPSVSNNQGYLIRTDSEGTLIWERQFDRSPRVEYFYGMAVTSDGGFLLSGQEHDWSSGPASQDAWLLKVDSLGCAYPNCTVGVEEHKKDLKLLVYPNPATDNLRIESQTPLAQFNLTDLAGRPSIQQTLKQVQGDVSIDVSNLPSGIYLLEAMTQDGRRSVQKVVVE